MRLSAVALGLLATTIGPPAGAYAIGTGAGASGLAAGASGLAAGAKGPAAGASGLAAGASGSGGIDAGAGECGPASAKTVARDAAVRVYVEEGASIGSTATRVCVRRTGRSSTLPTGSHTYVGQVVVGGKLVAYVTHEMGVDAGTSDIVVFDAVARRVVRRIRGVGDYVDACFIRFRDVTALAVSARGAVAWTVREGNDCKTTTSAVHGAPPGGAPELLEEAPGISPGSLRVSGIRVSWETSGLRRSARLAPAGA